MAFPIAFLAELTARNPIEEVVGQYVNLRRSGSNLFGLCPFHGEKTASFSVAPEKGIYYCFGCHRGGSVINFQMEIEGLDYPDAVRALAKRAGLEVPEDSEYREHYKLQERLWALNREAAHFFHESIQKPIGADGLAYAEKRGMPPKVLTKFGIGFAPNSWNSLCDAMLAKGYSKEELLATGLASEKNGNIYDRFRNRLIFPIIDVRSNVIGFGGRVMDDATPKYLNSPESIVFNKRKNLFALNYAKKSKLGYIILVEGYMDAIALHQYGFDCAVASLGTSLTDEHANLLTHYTKQVVLIYDGDNAGQNATQRAIPMLEKAGLQVKVLKMKDAKDPDEYLKKFGADRFRILLEEASGRVEYQLNAIQRKYDLASDEQRVQYLSDASNYICMLNSAVQREIYGARVAETASISTEAMMLEINKAFKRRTAKEKKQKERMELSPAIEFQPTDRKIHYENVRSAVAEERIIAMLLTDSSLAGLCKDISAEQFSSPLLGKVYSLILQNEKESIPVSAASLPGLSVEEMAHLARMMQRENGPVSENAFRDCIGIIIQESDQKHAKTEATDNSILEFQKKMREKKGLK